jgi:hypothetical protein
MIRRLALSFALVTLIGALATGWLYASETQGTTITFAAPVHFLMLDGNDVQVPGGTYRIEQAGESQLRLLSESAQPIQIAATKIVHEERVSSPTAIAVMEEGQDDTLHLLLVLADGQGLDATGSFSGLRSRGTLSALQPVQVQSAVNQFKVIAPPAPAQPSPQQMLPAAAIVRVPQASVGSVVAQINQGTWITWNYLAMNHPEAVAQTFADVQAGKKPLSVLAGYASQPELSDMLKTNWSAEVARLNAASPMLNQGTVTPRGIPASPTRALTTTRIASIPIQLPPKNLGTVWANESAKTIVTVTAVGDGYVDASLDLNATNRHFRIVNAISYTGRMVNNQPEVYQTVQGGQYQDVIVDPHNPPAQLTKAGFISISTRQGQRIDFTIAFEPVALGMAPVGNNDVTLTVTGVPSIDIHSNQAPPNWTRVAPIHAYFAGINFGAILYTDQQHTSVLTGQSVDMTVLVRNASSNSIIGTITAAQLPTGVTMAAVPVSVAGQTTQRMILRFQVTDAAYDGSVQPVVVQLTYMNQTRPLNLDLSIYHPWVFWFFPAYMDTASNSWHPIPGIPENRSDQSSTGVMNVWAWLKNNGDFWWKIHAYNTKDVDFGGTNFDVFARWKATGSTDKISVHIGPKTNPQYYESLKNFAPLASYFIPAVEQSLTFSLADR